VKIEKGERKKLYGALNPLSHSHSSIFPMSPITMVERLMEISPLAISFP